MNASRVIAENADQRHLPAWAPAELVQECGCCGTYLHERQDSDGKECGGSGIRPQWYLPRHHIYTWCRQQTCFRSRSGGGNGSRNGGGGKKTTSVVAAAMDGILLGGSKDDADDTRIDGTARWQGQDATTTSQ